MESFRSLTQYIIEKLNSTDKIVIVNTKKWNDFYKNLSTENKQQLKDLPNFIDLTLGDYVSHILFSDGTIVGHCTLELYEDEPNEITFWAIGIDKNNLGKGYSKMLLDSVFKYVKGKYTKMYITRYTEAGANFLKKNLHLYAKKYKVSIEEN